VVRAEEVVSEPPVMRVLAVVERSGRVRLLGGRVVLLDKVVLFRSSYEPEAVMNLRHEIM
jgi:hypothetical protein